MSVARGASLAALLVLVAAAATAGGNGKPDGRSARPITIAVIGDTPYGDPQVENFPNDVEEINADPKVRLGDHLGDIKNGSSRCDDAYYDSTADDFDAFRDPLVFTPGDNEWTDCHRANNGGYMPTERLAKLRRIFFPEPGETIGGRAKEVDAQAAPFVENVRWSQSRVEFGTLHVVGSNNAWAPWFDVTPRSREQIDEYEARNAANLRWLDQIFRAARQHDARAMCWASRRTCGTPRSADPTTSRVPTTTSPTSCQALAAQTLAYGRPVLLLNGDSHQFVDEHPLAAGAPGYQKSMYGLTEMCRTCGASP